MMKRKSLLFALATALAVAYPGAAWMTGKRLEAKLNKTDKPLHLLPNIKIIQQRYDRGIFSSTQESTIEFIHIAPASNAETSTNDAATVNPKPLQLQVINHIQHGPIPGILGFGAGKVETEFVLDKATQAELKSIFGNKHFLEIRTVLHYTGGGDLRISSPAVRTTVGSNNDQLDWKGLQFDLGFDANYKTIQVNLTSPGVDIVTANGSTTLKIGSMTMQAKATRAYADGFIYLGDSKMHIHSLSFVNTQAGNKGLQLRDLVLDSNTRSENDLLHSTLQFGVGNITMNDLPIGSFHYDYSFRNLHGPSIHQLLSELAQEEQLKRKADAAKLEALQQNIKQYALEILKHDPQITLDRLSLTGKNGEFKISGKLGLVGVQDEDFDLPAQIFAKLVSTGQLSLSDGLVDDVIDASQSDPEARNMMRSMFYSQIETWESQGYLERQGKTYQSQLSWKEGQFLVNGKSFPAKPAASAPNTGLPAATDTAPPSASAWIK